MLFDIAVIVTKASFFVDNRESVKRGVGGWDLLHWPFIAYKARRRVCPA